MGFTIGLAQCKHPEDGDSLSLARRWVHKAQGEGVDLLVFPESLLTRYEKERAAFLQEAQPLDGPFASGMNELAQQAGIWIIYTVNEANPCGNPFNTAVLAGPDGCAHGVYRKTHLFDTDFTRESDRMAAGEALMKPVATPLGVIGLGICYDLRFPELARAAALDGAQLIVYPAAWVSGGDEIATQAKIDQWRTLLRARAIENEVFVAGVSRCDAGYIGCSCVFGPAGEALAVADVLEQLVVARIDVDVIAAVRSRMPLLEHRRPELYK